MAVFIRALALVAACRRIGVCRPRSRRTRKAYPNRPIKVIVPFPAGGPTDGMARIISDRLGQVLGQSIVIENKGGGAGGSIGAKFVATSDPDGYTILITPGGSLTTGPAVHANIGYDPAKAFVPVALLIETPLIIRCTPTCRRNRWPSWWPTQGQSRQDQLGLAGLWHGAAPAAELFKLEAGVNVLHVPYRGTAPMLAAVVAGEVQVVADPMTTSLPHIQSGKLRALAIAGAERSPKLPDVPTVIEAGYPKLQSPFWLGVVAPAGTPPIIDKLNAAFRESMAPAETRARLANLGADIKIGTPAEFGTMLAAELAQWTAVVKAANIKVE